MASIPYRYCEYKGYSTSEKADISDYSDAAEIESWAVDSMRWANGAGLIQGRSATELAPKGIATRAEVAAVLHRFLELYESKQ